MEKMIKYAEAEQMVARLVVVGIGGGGGNAIDTMIASRTKGVDFIAANTDAQALRRCRATTKIQLGTGLGAGSNPEVGKQHTEASLEDIVGVLEGADMVFITAGMGGGTGTGGAPVVAKHAREMGILTVGVVTKPFDFEGRRRMRIAEAGIAELRESVDSLIVIPNQKLVEIAGKSMAFADAFSKADEVLLNAVEGISDLVVKPGLINVDFADVRAVMGEHGMALMGIGVGSGEDRAIKAAQEAISSPLLDDISIQGARGVLINVCGPEDMALHEIQEACAMIEEEVDEDALIIWGASINPNLKDEIKFTVVATGFQRFQDQPINKKPGRSRREDLDIPTHIRENRRNINVRDVIDLPINIGIQQRSGTTSNDKEKEWNIPTFIRNQMN